VARTTGAAPARSCSTGRYRCCSNSCAWWPARVMLPALPLKRRLHRCNACRPKVLQLGAAPSTCRLSTGCSGW